MIIGEKIRFIRNKKGWSQEELGERLCRINENGISRQAVGEWERGNSEPCLDNIRDLAEVFHVSYDVLLDDSIDLNDEIFFEEVLCQPYHIQRENVKTTESFFYSIITYVFSLKECGWLLATGVFIFATVLSGILNIFFPVALYCLIGFAILSVMLIPFSVKGIHSLINGEYAGYITYKGIEIKDQYVRINGYESQAKTLNIPVETITKIELVGKKCHKCGDVLVTVKDKTNAMRICNVKYPQNLIDTYNNIFAIINK